MKNVKKLTVLFLIQLLAISLLVGCGSDDKKSNDTKDKNTTNESSDDKNTIAPIDTISGLELVESFKSKYDSDAFMMAYNNNLFFNSEKKTYIKDIYGNYDDITLPLEKGEDALHITYGKDYMFFYMESNPTGEKDEDEYHIVVISKNGSSIYIDDATYYRYILNADGNLVYLDSENNLICIEPSTAKEIYRIALGDVYVSHDDLTKYYAHITYAGNVNKIYNLSNGNMVFEATVENNPDKERYTKDIYLMGKNIVVQDWNEDASDIVKHSVYDETGALLYCNENPDEIPSVEQVGWNDTFLSIKYIDFERYSAIYRADLTPIVEFHIPDDYSNRLELLDFDSYYLDKACDSGISIYTTESHRYGYIVTDTEAIKFTYLDTIHPGYDDWYVTYTDTQNKRFVLNMANGAKFEVLSAEDSRDYSDIDQISPNVYYGSPSQAQTIFFSESTDTTTSVYDEKGTFLFSTDKENSYPTICPSIDMNKLFYQDNSYVLIYDIKTQNQIKITDEDVIKGSALAIVKDKYLMYSQTNKDTEEVTLKQFNLEDNTITELVTAKDASFYITNDALLVYTSERDNFKNYDIYYYK